MTGKNSPPACIMQRLPCNGGLCKYGSQSDGIYRLPHEYIRPGQAGAGVLRQTADSLPGFRLVLPVLFCFDERLFFACHPPPNFYAYMVCLPYRCVAELRRHMEKKDYCVNIIYGNRSNSKFESPPKSIKNPLAGILKIPKISYH